MGSGKMNKDISLKEILQTLKKWELESLNHRNDGWVKRGYKEKIKKVFSQSGKILKKLI